MATLSLKKLTTRLQESFARERDKVRDRIVVATKPDANIDLTSAITKSRSVLGSYATLDWQHRGEILSLSRRIGQYTQDASRTRPLNIIMQAEPGSGKSHLVKCLAESARLTGMVKAVTFNMSGMQGIEDLTQPLEAVRNLKVIDKTPILFLDEFDSHENHYPLLLPLMWDGELHIGHRDLKTGKLVIILAGSGASIDEAMKEAKNFQQAAAPKGTKLVDLLSRINGGEFTIPDLDAVSDNRDRRVDKVCIAVSLLTDRYGDTLRTVPWSLLHFIAVTKFKYGVRSITHLVESLPPPDDKSSEIQLDWLPLGNVERLKASSLAYHLMSDDGPAAIVATWKASTQHSVAVRIAAEPEDDEIPF